MCVFAVTDPRNVEVPSYFLPLLVGLVVGMIGLGKADTVDPDPVQEENEMLLAFGFNCGFALNPARDLGPRIFTAFAGWGVDVFRYGRRGPQAPEGPKPCPLSGFGTTLGS